MSEIGKTPVKIFIVDDHRIVSESLKQRLDQEQDMEVCGMAAGATEAVAAIARLEPRLVIVDINLKGSVSGLELLKALKERFPEIRTLALSMHEEDLFAERAIRAGAMGYVMKSELTQTLIVAIRQVMSGKIYLSENMTSRLLRDLVRNGERKISDNMQNLTDRELEVLRLLGQGNKASEIARMLNLSVKTIDSHRLNIREKLDLKNSSELMKYAIDWVRSL
jgi:DNA-binding NarL/FixJ family response regulator